MDRRTTYGNLKHVITGCKKTLGLFSVRDIKDEAIPRVSNETFGTRQIKELPTNYLKAVESAGHGPVIEKMCKRLEG